VASESVPAHLLVGQAQLFFQRDEQQRCEVDHQGLDEHAQLFQPRGQILDIRQIQPIARRPAYQRLDQRALQVLVETDCYRNAALGLYESVGFRVQRDVRRVSQGLHLPSL